MIELSTAAKKALLKTARARTSNMGQRIKELSADADSSEVAQARLWAALEMCLLFGGLEREEAQTEASKATEILQHTKHGYNLPSDDFMIENLSLKK